MQPSQFEWYLPVLMLVALTILFAAGMLLGSVLLGKKGAAAPIKNTAYECGMLPIGAGTPRMSVKFFMVAMLFILFDIEVVFLYPWAVVYKEMLTTHAGMILWAMLSFLGTLFIGYLYALKKGALDWDR